MVKSGLLIEDLDLLCRVAIGYDITVTNSGAVPLENVNVVDTLLGNFLIGHLDPGQSILLTPVYYITEQNILNELVENTATASGTYDSIIVSSQATFEFPIDLSTYEDIIRLKSGKIHDFEASLRTNWDDYSSDEKIDGLRIYENFVRCEENQISLFEKIFNEEIDSGLSQDQMVDLLGSLEDLLFRSAVNQREFSEFLQSKWNELGIDDRKQLSLANKELSRRLNQLHLSLEYHKNIQERTSAIDRSIERKSRPVSSSRLEQRKIVLQKSIASSPGIDSVRGTL